MKWRATWADGLPRDELLLQPVRPGICYGALNDVFLLYYQDSPNLEDLRTRAGLINELLKAHPDGITFLSVIDAPLGPAFPSAEARAESGRQLSSAAGHLLGGAVVITGGAVKVKLTTMLLSRLPKQIHGAEMKFCGDVNEAARWCLDLLGVREPALGARTTALVDGVAEMQARVGAAEC